MRKLFLTFLMLGAFIVAKAALAPGDPKKVTVTSFENGVLTVNYNKNGEGELNKNEVDHVLNKWVEDTYDLRGPENEEARAAKLKEVVKTLKLTGDWENNHLKKDAYIIFEMINLCANDGVGVGLDLSACGGFESRFISVDETYDDIRMDGSVTFTYEPVGTQTPGSSEVTVTTNRSEVSVTPNYSEVEIIDKPVSISYSGNTTPVDFVNSEVAVAGPTFVYKNAWGNGLTDLPQDFLDDYETHTGGTSHTGGPYPYPFNGDNAAFIQWNGNENAWFINLPNQGNSTVKITRETSYTYTYTDENNTEKIQYNTEGLRQDSEGNWWYTRYGMNGNYDRNMPRNFIKIGENQYVSAENVTYAYEDENGEGHTQYDNNGLKLDGNGDWRYIRYKYTDMNGYSQYAQSTDNFVSIDGKYYSQIGYKYSYEDEKGETVVRTDNPGFKQENDKYWYEYTLYTYVDQNGQTISQTHSYNLVERDGKLWYDYIKSEGTFSFAGYLDQLKSVSFPNSNNFTFIPNEVCKASNTLTSITLPASIRAIGNHAFASSKNITEINFPDNLEEIGGGAFEYNNFPSVDLRNTKITKIRWCTFMENKALTECYYPDALTIIEYNAFKNDQHLLDVDLSNCHYLTLISVGAYADCFALEGVKICSHPKVLRGNGHGTGCFNNCKAIKTVEVVACYPSDDYPPVTDITKCYCEIGAFDYDITEVQTEPTNVSKGAKLIFPDDMPVGTNQVYAGTTHETGVQITQGTPYANPYTSPFDFFVGDFKTGAMLNQTNLEVLYNDVPNNLGPAPGYGKPVNQPDLGEYVPGLSQNDNDKYVGDTRYSYNGWIEFINTETAEYVPTGKFLRTYSRTLGDGPCLLPKEITAYRAVDYKSVSRAWVQDKRNGTHYYTDPTVPEDERVDENYIQITNDTDKSLYAGGNRYSFVTTGGTLYLKPLVAKKAYAVVDGTTYSGYTDENKDFFDSEAIYNGNVLENVPGGYSYVPENTGVVLYSDGLNEDALFVLTGDFGTDIVYKEFPHTGARYEEQRRAGGEGVNTNNDINMLQGSYGEGCAVAPVSPWEWDVLDEENHVSTGGHYSFDEPKAYRNFACVNTNYNQAQSANDKTYGWRRLTPSWMKENRAYAKIPVGRFDNNNENQSQMPDFSKDDLPEEDTTGGNGTNVDQTFGDNTLISIFDDGSESGAVVDGIKTVNIVVVNADNDAWYTTQGVRISHPTKGVYIHNGKKVVIK